jgi:HTH-type transcriptional regulator/antitoxin HigA
MATTASRPFAPDYAMPPGESLRDTLEALDMTQAELAERTGLSTKHINQIVSGVAPVTPETALALERVTGAPAAFWTSLEAAYALSRARDAEAEDTVAERDWIQAFPLQELRRRGVLNDQHDDATARQELLAFFGVAGRGAWERIWGTPEAAFRRSRAYRIDNFATACWLRLGELEAVKVTTEPFDAGKFRAALARVRRTMTAEPSVFVPLMRTTCAQAGVAIALVDEVKGSRAQGAVRWLSPTKALLQLSLRLKHEDHFWFSFFHEAGHLLLHGRRDAYVEFGKKGEDGNEAEADVFSRRYLISDLDAARLAALQSEEDVRAFADELRLPPAVVVGRMQHDGLIGFNRWNHLRRQLRFVASGE